MRKNIFLTFLVFAVAVGFIPSPAHAWSAPTPVCTDGEALANFDYESYAAGAGNSNNYEPSVDYTKAYTFLNWGENVYSAYGGDGLTFKKVGTDYVMSVPDGNFEVYIPYADPLVISSQYTTYTNDSNGAWDDGYASCFYFAENVTYDASWDIAPLPTKAEFLATYGLGEVEPPVEPPASQEITFQQKAGILLGFAISAFIIYSFRYRGY